MIVKHTLSCVAGELSDLLDGRTDLDKYNFGCRILENFIPLPQGAIQKRPGMEYRGKMVPAATAGRVVEFQVSTTESSMLIVGGGKLAVFTDGSPALDTGVPIELAVPWADADLPLLRWKQINSVVYFTHPDHKQQKLVRYAADDWELYTVDYDESPPLLPENIVDEWTLTTNFSVVTSTWSAASVAYITGQRVTHASKTWVCQKGHTSSAPKAPGLSTATYTTFVTSGRLTQTVVKPLWVEGFADLSATVGQVIDVTASRDTWLADHVGSIWEISKKRTSTNYEVFLAATNANNGLYSNTVVIQGGWTFQTYGTWKGTFTLEKSEDRGLAWQEVRSFNSDGERNVSAEDEEPKRVLMRIKWTHSAAGSADPRGVLAASDALIRGLVRITTVTDARTAVAEVVTPVERTTTYNWAESAWNNVQGYPRAIELHQGRVVMGATYAKPHTVWGSDPDDYEKFYVTGLPDAAYRHTVAIGERDPILWLISERFLLIGTGSGEWIMHGEDEEKAITPDFGTAKRHDGYGSHNGGVAACFADDVSLFVQRGGTRVREFAYSFQADRYEAANLNLLADHIFTAPIEDIAVMRMPWQVVWFVSDGKLYGLTYERKQGVAAWHRHTTQGTVLSVATIRATSNEDEVWFLVDRGDGINIERFRPGHLSATPDDGWWQDAAVEIASPFDYSEAAHLAGLEVTAWWEGMVFGGAVFDGATWPFLSGVTVAGLLDVTTDTGTYSPNGFYPPAGDRDGKQWFTHEFVGAEGFFFQWSEAASGTFKWRLYLGGAIGFDSGEDVATPDLVTTWDEGGEFGTLYVTASSDEPLAFPRTITIAGTVFPDADGTLLYAGMSGGRPCYSTTGDQLADDYPFTIVLWNSSEWDINHSSSGSQLDQWRSLDDVASPDLATTWYEYGGAGVPTVTAGEIDGPVIMGLRYDSVYQPMTPEVALANGSSRSREGRVHRLVFSLRNTRGGKFGEDPNGRLDPIEVGSASELFTGEVEKELGGGHSRAIDVCLVSDEAFPVTMRTLALKLTINGDAD